MHVPKAYERIVAAGVIASGATGALIGPGTDIPILISIWIVGAIRIAALAGRPMDEQFWFKVATGAFLGGIAWIVSGEVINTALLILGPLGWVAAFGVNAAVNVVFTYRFLGGLASVFDRLDSAAAVSVEAMIGKVLEMMGLHDGALRVEAQLVVEDLRNIGRLFVTYLPRSGELIEEFMDDVDRIGRLFASKLDEVRRQAVEALKRIMK